MIYGTEKARSENNVDVDSPDVWEFMAPFFCVGCSSVLVCLHGTVRPTSFIRVDVQAPTRLEIMSCAMPRLYVAQMYSKPGSARCTLLESLFNVHSLLYILDNAFTDNTSRRTAMGELIALLVHLLTTVAWYSTWSSIVLDSHNHTNAALKPQCAMRTELLSVQASNETSNLYRGHN